MSVRHFAAGGVTGTLLATAISLATPAIQKQEGRRYTAYHDVARVLTVCDGHTGNDIVVKHVYSDAECDAMTEADTAKAAQGVLKVSPQLVYHPYVLASMISFTYNLGTVGYAKSSIAKDINRGDFLAACNLLPRYNHAGGKVVHGLTLRREKEKELCLSTLLPQNSG